MRDVAQNFYHKEVGNGRQTSFWFDKWSDKGRLFDLLGDRGMIDTGVRKDASLEEAVRCVRRRRKHRNVALNEIEAELNMVKEKLKHNVEDVIKWKGKAGYRESFSTSETWVMTREAYSPCSWAKGIWFSHATPKFSFITWLAMLNRLATMDRISKWSLGADTTCVLCKNAVETRDHLFFQCDYSSQRWKQLTHGILRNAHSNSWSAIITLLSDNSRGVKSTFCVRYSFQAAIYALWRERNRIKHGEKPTAIARLQKLVDKVIRNKLSLLQMQRRRGMVDGLQFWFGTRV
ncbi:uncharacterized protein LOC106373404 [Brassica napus]|uniref:uncharacterized protein LOC106373404 n=1 Tax=Brassica napus TaxID=3708 RepID=UPI0006AA6572|nr:uncharacterized protein LOC106373404 [Brassica napus]